jgi:uncharacterized membrane protein YkvA (DUF1232 family)
MDNMLPEMRAEMTDMAGEVREVVRRLPSYAKLTWLLVKDPNLTPKQRAALMGAIGYSISPIDAVPGFIPVIGQLDDLAIVLYTLRWIMGKIPPHRSADYFAKSGLTMDILDEDLTLVHRSGVKVLKRMVAVMGWTALAIWAVGKIVVKEVSRRMGK